MNNIKYIGIDVHQSTSVLAIMNHRGKIINETILETTGTTIVDFLKGQRGTVWVTFEECTQANWLYDLIEPHVAKVVVCDPRKNKQSGNKSDKIDAKRLANLLRMNGLTAVYHGQQSTRMLKELARSYISLQKDCNRVMNRVKAMFRGRGIPCRGKTVYRPENREEWLEKLNNGGARTRAERLLEQLDLISVLCSEAAKDLVQEGRKHKDYKILRKIPGLGPIRSSLILAIVMTPYRFRNKRQFWAYAGFAVVRRGSAEYEITHGAMKRTKKKPLPRGLNNNYNHILKNIFKGAALTAAYRGSFKELLEQRVENGTAENLAILTLARKIASITLTLWKKGESFDNERHRLSERTA